MADIMDYLDWRGDVPFSVSPVNEVDEFILCKIGTPDLSGMVPEDGAYVTVGQAVEAYKAAGGDLKLGIVASEFTVPVFFRLPETERFRDLQLSGYRLKISETRTEQFSALTVRLPDGRHYVTFRGTDDTLVGWKENFQLTGMDAVPAQADALEYLQWAAETYPGELVVGGHSKGANLSVYAASLAPEEIQDRITLVCNYDGPGFMEDFLDNPGYRRILPKIRTLMPENATVGTLLMSFFFVLSSLYLGRDAAYLAAMPLKPRTILSAKLTQVWISETCLDALLLLPACILYGVKAGVDAGFWLRLVPVWLLIALLPICIIAFAGSLIIRVSALWKHREMVMTVGGIALMIAYMFLMMNLGGVTGDSAESGEMLQRFMTDNAARIEGMASMFPPAAWAAKGLLGKDYGLYILWIAVSLAAPVITVWLLGFVYRKLSLLQTETPEGGMKKFTGKESFGSGSQFAACCKREIKSILRVPSYATNILPISFMPLLMVIMMFVIGGRISGDESENLEVLLDHLNPALIMSVLAAVLAYMAGMNPALSTAVTREGKSHGFLTAIPVPAKTVVGAKLAVGYALSVIGVLAASAAVVIILPKYAVQAILAFILCMLFSYVNSVLALNRDIRKPRLDWVTEQEAVKQNFGVLISMLISWGILIALGILTYFLITWGFGMYAVFAILAVILAVLCALATIRMNRVTEKYYCAG